MSKSYHYRFTIGSFFHPILMGLGVACLVGVFSFLYLQIYIAAGVWLVPALFLLFAERSYSYDDAQYIIHQNISWWGCGLSIKKQAIQQPESILLKSKKVSQRISSRGTTTTLRYVLYQGYLQAADKKYLIAESKNEDKVHAKMEELADHLQIPIYKM